MRFTLEHTDPRSSARAGVFRTDHGEIRTPIFMPVGTVGSVKGVFHRDLVEEVGAQIILGNTYHLYLRPGTETLYKAGGLHRFAGWDRPILTDSGGFQVFSLTGIRKLTEEGCRFQSHIDGSRHLFTPENVIDTQRLIGADIRPGRRNTVTPPNHGRGRRAGWNGVSTGTAAPSAPTVTTSRSSRSYRGAHTPTSGGSRPNSYSSSTRTAMPSADSPSENPPR